ncbi:hypothetical protein YC2023_072184 [Brassica napus]
MLARQMNIRRMSGDWIASVRRLCARTPNYRPTILLSFFTIIVYACLKCCLRHLLQWGSL